MRMPIDNQARSLEFAADNLPNAIPGRSAAMDNAHCLISEMHFTFGRKLPQLRIHIAGHGHHGCDRFQFIQHTLLFHISRVQDTRNSLEELVYFRRKRTGANRDVRICDNPDFHDTLLFCKYVRSIIQPMRLGRVFTLVMNMRMSHKNEGYKCCDGNDG